MVDQETTDAIFRSTAAVGAALVAITHLLVVKGLITENELRDVLTNTSRPNFDGQTEALYQQVTDIILQKPGA